MIGTVAVTREQLEAQALRQVCACWHQTLVGALDETSDEELALVITDGMAYHHEEQKRNPADEAEFREELVACPDFKE